MHAGVEVLQVQELVEGADDGIAERTRLFFELFDAQRLQRPEGRGTLHGRRNLIIRHCRYQHSKKQEPEPGLELFTQAEIAWYESRRPRLRSGVSFTAWDRELAAWL